MKSPIITVLLILGFTPLLLQCVATEKEMQSMGVHLRTVDDRVVDIDEKIEALKEETVKQVQSRQAQTGDRVDRLESTLLKLQGQLEENYHHNRTLQEQLKQLEASLNGRMHTLAANNTSTTTSLETRLVTRLDDITRHLTQQEEQLARLDSSVQGIKASREQEAVNRATEAARKAREAAARAKAAQEKAAQQDKSEAVTIYPEQQKKIVAESTTASPSPATPTNAPADLQFRKALGHLKEKRYNEAHNAFAAFLKQHPNHDKAVSARYWLAESLYNQQEYEMAILEYQKVIIDHPRHDKAPAAMFKQGLAFEKINDAMTAAIIFKKIVDDYPGSDQASKAAKRLDSLQQ